MPIRKSLHVDLPPDLSVLADIFGAAGKKFYLVGGAVRDALLGKTPKDFDITTDARPVEVKRMLSGHPEYKILELGVAFGVTVIITPERNQYEIATFRRDLSGGRRPDAVEFTTVDKDVMRRDLTMNALFYDIQNEEVVDYVGGIEDIKNGVVKAVGNPRERFFEDPLRILRALRFAGRFGTSIDPETSQAIKEDNGLGGVSPERIRDEFLKGIKSAKSVPYFLRLVEEYDLWDQVLRGLKVNTQDYKDERDSTVQVALLLRDNPSDLVLKQLNKLKYSAEEAQQVSFLLNMMGLTVENAYALKKRAINIKMPDGLIKKFALESGKPEKRLIDAFLIYRPSVAASSFPDIKPGKELGQAISQREQEIFHNLLVEVRVWKGRIKSLIREALMTNGRRC